MNGAAVLKAEELSFGYRNAERLVLDGLSFEMGPGGIVALVGANGAGKTTLLRLLSGLFEPRSGRIERFGKALRAKRADFADNVRIGALVAAPLCWRSLRVAEWLGAFADLSGTPKDPCAERRAALLRRFDLDPLARVSVLSAGNLQKLHVVRALQHAPELLLLDEPTSALDPASRREFWSVLREEADRGSAVLVSSHQLDELDRSVSRALLLKGGRIARDLPGGCARPWRVVAAAPEEEVARALGELWNRAAAHSGADGLTRADWPDDVPRNPVLAKLVEAGIPVAEMRPLALSEMWGDLL